MIRWCARSLALVLLVSPVAWADTPEEVVEPKAQSTFLGKLSFGFHGYYRARATQLWNVPVARLDNKGYLASDTHTGRDDASNANYLTNRLRLEPSILYGEAGQAPTVGLYSQFDVLDTVVWGDNARKAGVPLFATNPSNTGSDGDERPSILLRRLWLEFGVPVGQVRIGRQASQGGLGLLFNDGNGFRNDFGDADKGSTFDRVMFATRPLTIANALRTGDKSETPLILIAAYDRLVQDPLGFGSDPHDVERRQRGGPYDFLSEQTCGDERQPDGETRTRKCDSVVGQWVTGLIWRDTNLNLRRSTDELMLGAIYVNRSQAFSDSRLHIIDGFWKFQMGLWESGPSLLTEGEVYAIRGHTNGIKVLSGSYFDEDTGLSDEPLVGDIFNWAGRVGLTSKAWDAVVEMGHAGGDEEIVGGDGHFKLYPMQSDYRMGLLMYPVAVASRTYNTNAARQSDALHGGGGVFNSTYLNLKGRYRLEKETYQIEFVGQTVLGWADTLNGGEVLGLTADYFAPRDASDPWADNKCGVFDPACALGWEVDVAIKVKWLPFDVPGAGPADRYMLQWSNEFGVMQAGQALAPRLAKGAETLWTAQSRIAFLW